MKRRLIPWVLAPLLALLLLCQACDLDRPKPDEKFYCKVDGKHWRPESDGDFKAITLISELTNDGMFLRVQASNVKNGQDIVVSIVDSLGIDSTDIGKLYEVSLRYIFPTNPPAGYFSKNNQTYTTSSTHKGTFRILSIERDRRVPNEFKLKAEFEFTASNPYGELVKITHGQFYDWVRIPQ